MLFVVISCFVALCCWLIAVVACYVLFGVDCFFWCLMCVGILFDVSLLFEIR